MVEMPTLRRRLLGAELRRLREAAGFSLDDAARILECDRSKISRIESGRRGMRPKEVRELLTEYGVEETRRHALADLVRQVGKRGWWQHYATNLDDAYLDFVSLEDGVAAAYGFQTQVIPALVQTEAYARSIAEANHVNDARGKQEQQVAACMMRQGVLTRETNPLRLWAILGEAAIRQMVGGSEIMRDQLHHLIKLQAKLPNVTLQVLPFDSGAHVSAGGSFVVLSFPEPTDLGVVHIDNLTGGLYLEAPEDVECHRLAFKRLATCALPIEASVWVIEKAITDLQP